jgi:predicted peptidase
MRALCNVPTQPVATRSSDERARQRLILLGIFLPALFLPAVVTAAETGFLHRTVQVDSVTYRYQVYVPASYSPSKKWPVVLFLHGGGERGSDGERQTTVGLPARLRQMKDFPAIVVMPQCRQDVSWGDPLMEAQTFAALDATMKEFNGDSERLYLTGLSMGGYGTWAFGYKYPEKFAALVPVCGGVVASGQAPAWHPRAKNPHDPYAETASRLTRVPVWAFHGERDNRVPVTESRKLTQAIKSQGGNVRYTEYPGVAHNAWDRAYWEEELLPWLLAQSRRP